MPTPRVIDLSHHNSIPESLHPARDAGIWGVIHKATEGTGFVDGKLEARFHLAKDAGMLWGGYHFLRPGNITRQAEFFCATMAPYTDDQTLFACDFEVAGIALFEVDQFMDVVERLSGRSCVLYTGHSLKDAIAAGQSGAGPLQERRLWLAQYASQPILPKGWKSAWLWQYSDKGEVPGIDGPVDVNAYMGSIDDLEASWSGSHATQSAGQLTAKPEPTPVQRPTVGIITSGDVQIVVNGKTIA